VDLTLLPGRLSVCRLAPDAPWPDPAGARGILSVTRTADELSVVCPEGAEPPGAAVEGGWRAWRIAGPLPFDLVGVVASVTAVLAGDSIPVFVLSTYDSDLILVRDADVERAEGALIRGGHGCFRDKF
jgi:uncharacterized protein